MALGVKKPDQTGLPNTSQKWHNLVTIPFCDLTGTAAASEYKYQPVLTLTPQSIEFILYPLDLYYSLLTLRHLYT